MPRMEYRIKYLLILTTDELLAHSTTFFYMGMLGCFSLFNSEGFYDIPIFPVGRIVLEVDDLL